MRKTIFQTLLVCVFAFLGGIVSDQLLRPADSLAQMNPDGKYSALGSTRAFFDLQGRKRVDIDVSNSPVQDFYGSNGTLRLQLGLYGGEEKLGTEAGMPLISLSDTYGRLRLLLRTAKGKNQAPVLVMKDAKGKDRIVMGTAIDDPDEDPFLVYFDKFGAKHTVFGEY